MPECRNPECGKEIPKGMTYCDGGCLKRHLELKQENKTVDSTIEAVLKYMGIEKQNFSKNVAYNHWERFVQFLKDNSGHSWNDFLRPRLRSYIGIDQRYLNDFLQSCLAWGIIALENGNVIYYGIPKDDHTMTIVRNN